MAVKLKNVGCFSKLSVYPVVMEDRKRKFSVLVDMQTHLWLRTSCLFCSELTNVESFIILSVIKVDRSGFICVSLFLCL